MASTLMAAMLSLAGTTSAFFEPRNTVSRSSDGIGCNADVATSTAGFNARFYKYPAADLIPFNKNKFVANDYTTNELYTTAVAVTEPNFSITNLDSKHATLNNYDLINIPLYSSVVELKGYFVGMYPVSTLFFLFRTSSRFNR